MKRPSNFTQLAHENYILKIKYNELLNSYLLLLSQYNDLVKDDTSDNHPDHIKTINMLQQKNADLNRQLLENHKHTIQSEKYKNIHVYTDSNTHSL